MVSIPEFFSLTFFALLLLLSPNFFVGKVGVGLLVTLILAAEGLRIWAVGYAGSATRTRGDKVGQLVHAGPFRYVRNPLYIANIVLYVGTALLFGFSYLSAVMLVYFCLQYASIVAFEQSILSQTFGTQYIEYCNRVPKWFFSWTPKCDSSAHQFSLNRALRSERTTLIIISIILGIFLFKQLS